MAARNTLQLWTIFNFPNASFSAFIGVSFTLSYKVDNSNHIL